MRKLNGVTFVIIGATGDIGGELASLFRRAGANVVAVGRDASKLCTLVGKPGNRGIIPIQADCSQTERVEQLLKTVKDPDVLVTSTGTWRQMDRDTEPKTFGDQLTTDLDSIVRASVLPIFIFNQYFARQGKGLIVDISSHATSDFSLGGNLSYGSAKAAVRAFVEYLRLENERGSSVRISQIIAELVDTPKNRASPKGAGFGDEDWQGAVQISGIADWIAGNIDNSNAESEVVFKSKLRFL